MKPTAVVAIDYSLNGPAICVYPTDKAFSFENCEFFFKTDTRKRLEASLSLKNVHGEMFTQYTCQQDRHNNLAWWALGSISKYHVIDLVLEGYAMGARHGRVFDIGEATGHLKQTLWSHKIGFRTLPPKTLKKTVTGNGNANKGLMHTSFVQQTGIDLEQILGTKGITDDSPTSDIIDAFFLCQWSLANPA